MAVFVVEEKTDLDSTGGTVCVRSDQKDAYLAITELSDTMEAQKAAVTYAASKGVPNPHVYGIARPYPVDESGNPLENLVGGVGNGGYHVDVEIQAQ